MPDTIAPSDGEAATENATPTAVPVTLQVDAATTVSGLITGPQSPRWACVLAHGAGAGMLHPFMADLAGALAAHEVATLRFQFPYMERGGRRPDTPAVAHAAVRAAVDAARARWPGVPLFAGGKSFGGRMSSQAQAAAALPEVRGLFFVGFPLHPAGRPSTSRADHLSAVQVPMLFLQGTRDELASLELLRPIVQGLGNQATLHVVDDADHAFHVRARSGRRDDEVLRELARTLASWFAGIA